MKTPRRDQPADPGRRAVLRRAAYTAPAVVGSLLLARDARAQTLPSCGPAACQPTGTCGPDVAACQPNRCQPFENCGPFPCNPWCAPKGY